MDQVSIDRISKLHPRLREEAQRLYTQACAALTGRATPRIVQGLRTFAEQDQLYAQGRTAPGKVVTNSRGGQSYHNYGLAIDFALLVDGHMVSWDTTADFDQDHKADWMEVVHIFKTAGWSWGGDWPASKDLPHLEKRYGFGWRSLLELHQAKKVDAAGYVLI